MPVDTPNKQYQRMAGSWSIMRDVVAGEETIHERGEAYLPKLSGQDTDEYGAYVMRAGFYNATQRTIDGLSGMVFRKDPVTEIPSTMEEWSEDVTLDGLSLHSFAESLVEEQLVVSRAGVLVDFPPGGDNATQAQAERENRRPFFKLYLAETIKGWRFGQVNNRTQLIQARLREVVEVVDSTDPFKLNEIEQYRVLDLISEDDEGKPIQPFYRQQVWQHDGTNWVVVSEVVPFMGGAPMDFIPFIFVGPRGTQPEVAKPVLLDLGNTNLSHYRTIADLEHGAHYTALPTPWGTGVPENDQPEAIGPTTGWFTASETAAFGMLEFQGQGLEALEKRRQSKEEHMAALGARMLAPEKRQAESGEALGIRHSGEMSVLASLAKSISDGLTQALMIARDWMGLTDEVSIELNTDYMPAPMSPEMLKQLMSAWQGGGIGFEDLVYQLQRGEILREDRTAEDVKGDVQDETPPMPEPQGAIGNE